ncbi:hypothetical protein J2Z22_001980 [Paenibacillus forsythiae]|uniref:DUF2642 domain-containing protein n=1 Tax=Paenibacillus forsythiae TaxID=365616 RepID=A0ABU3H6M9_9BACL|nr:hypothetical protein [Paenibacillus forsythiae]MDT3426454.1 hypothetical protein [Paenibacillus forsythiae]
MSLQPAGYQQQVLFKANPASIESLKSLRNHLHHICRTHVNRYVRIETIDGQVFVGRIVHCERGLLTLAVPRPGGQRSVFGSPYSAQDELILTLVLYELLVITLLYT